MKNESMGPCRSCGRHVLISQDACPFCGARWRSSMLASGALAVSLLLGGALASATVAAPVPDRGPAIQEPAYGAPRPPSPRETETAIAWSRGLGDWKAQIGLSPGPRSWADHKEGTTVEVQLVTLGSPILKISYKLTRLTVDAITLQSALAGEKPLDRTLPLQDLATHVTRVTDGGKETLEIDGKKLECDVKSYEMPGRTFKVWWTKDAPGGWAKVVSGEESTVLVRPSEKLKAGGKEYDCSVWTTTRGKVSSTEWRATAVPGLIVRWRDDLTKAWFEVTTVTKGK